MNKIFCALLILVVGPSAAAQAAVPKTATAAMQARTTPVVKALALGESLVVGISTLNPVDPKRSPFPRTFDAGPGAPAANAQGIERALGSGILIDDLGNVLTHESILNQATTFRIVLSDGRRFDAAAAGTDVHLHLAVLRIVKPVDLHVPKILLGDPQSLLMGETVAALGNPDGKGLLASSGIIASKNLLRTDGNHTAGFIQTDVMIYPEIVGGALLDINGALLGINAYVPGEPGKGFVIPIDGALKALRGILQSEEKPGLWLGVTVREESNGFKMVNIIPQSPAQTAGLLPGDMFYAVDGKPVESRDDLQQRVVEHGKEEPMKLDLVRNGEPLRVEIPGQDYPIELALSLSRDLVGLDVLEINAETTRRYKLKTNQGVVVRRVVAGSPAAKLGIEAGDVIRQIGPFEVVSLIDFKRAVLQARQTPTVLMLVQRGGETSYLSLSTAGNPSAPL